MGTAQIRAVDGVPFGAAGIDPAVAAHPHILVSRRPAKWCALALCDAAADVLDLELALMLWFAACYPSVCTCAA
jgi:hypothetical protein